MKVKKKPATKKKVTAKKRPPPAKRPPAPEPALVIRKKKVEPVKDGKPDLPPHHVPGNPRLAYLGLLPPGASFLIPPPYTEDYGRGYGRVISNASGRAKVEFWWENKGEMKTEFWAPGTEVLLDNQKRAMKVGAARTPAVIKEVVTNLWTEYGPHFYHRIDARAILFRANLVLDEITPEVVAVAKARNYFRLPIRQTPLDKSNPDWHKGAPEKAAPAAPAEAKAPGEGKSPPAPRSAEAAAFNATRTGERKKPGVLAVILGALKAASKKKPVTKEEIHAKLVAEFPDRDARGMMSTIHSQVPRGLLTEKKITVQTNGKGGWWVE